MADDKTAPPWDLWTDEELEALKVSVLAEQQHRRTMTEASALADQVSRQVTEADHLEDGGPWIERDFIGYPRAWRVTHHGKLWRSLRPNNMDEPGVAGWREEAPAGAVPDYLKPAKRSDAYKLAERVMFDGRVYAATRGGVMGSPAEEPSSWRQEGPLKPVGPPTSKHDRAGLT